MYLIVDEKGTFRSDQFSKAIGAIKQRGGGERGGDGYEAGGGRGGKGGGKGGGGRGGKGGRGGSGEASDCLKLVQLIVGKGCAIAWEHAHARARAHARAARSCTHLRVCARSRTYAHARTQRTHAPVRAHARDRRARAEITQALARGIGGCTSRLTRSPTGATCPSLPSPMEWLASPWRERAGTTH